MTFPQDAADLAGGGRIPLLGFGTWQIKGAKARRAVGWALDAGYRHLDTATIYGNEREVGAGLADSGVARDDVFVTTKCPPRNAGHELDTLRTSLDLLGTDHVDLWLIHWPGRSGADLGHLAGVHRGPGQGARARHRREQLLARPGRRAHPRDRCDPGGEPDRVEPAAVRPRGPRRAPRARRRARGLQRPARRHPGAPGDHRHRRAARPDAGPGDRPLAPAARRRGHPQVVARGADPVERRRGRLTLTDDDMAALDALGRG